MCEEGWYCQFSKRSFDKRRTNTEPKAVATGFELEYRHQNSYSINQRSIHAVVYVTSGMFQAS